MQTEPVQGDSYQHLPTSSVTKLIPSNARQGECGTTLSIHNRHEH